RRPLFEEDVARDTVDPSSPPPRYLLVAVATAVAAGAVGGRITCPGVRICVACEESTARGMKTISATVTAIKSSATTSARSALRFLRGLATAIAHSPSRSYP